MLRQGAASTSVKVEPTPVDSSKYFSTHLFRQSSSDGRKCLVKVMSSMHTPKHRSTRPLRRRSERWPCTYSIACSCLRTCSVGGAAPDGIGRANRGRRPDADHAHASRCATSFRTPDNNRNFHFFGVLTTNHMGSLPRISVTLHLQHRASPARADGRPITTRGQKGSSCAPPEEPLGEARVKNKRVGRVKAAHRRI